MFDHLNRVELGDVFYIEVLGRHLKYKVTDIRTVLPNGATWNKVAEKTSQPDHLYALRHQHSPPSGHR